MDRIIGQKGPYKMTLRSKQDAGEIYLYGSIGADWFGDGITAKMFADDLKQLGAVKTIDIRINSDGGDVFEGRTIYSMLTQHAARKTVYVDGLAASIASVIAMAGDEIAMADGTFVMIHEARGGRYGTAEDHRRTAELIEQVNATITATYVARTGNAEDKVKAWMADETWFDSSAAVKNGFADRVIAPLKVAACVSAYAVENYRHLPARLRPRLAAAQQKLAALPR